MGTIIMFIIYAVLGTFLIVAISRIHILISKYIYRMKVNEINEMGFFTAIAVGLSSIASMMFILSVTNNFMPNLHQLIIDNFAGLPLVIFSYIVSIFIYSSTMKIIYIIRK